MALPNVMNYYNFKRRLLSSSYIEDDYYKFCTLCVIRVANVIDNTNSELL